MMTTQELAQHGLMRAIRVKYPDFLLQHLSEAVVVFNSSNVRPARARDVDGEADTHDVNIDVEYYDVVDGHHDADVPLAADCGNVIIMIMVLMLQEEWQGMMYCLAQVLCSQTSAVQSISRSA